MRRLHGSVRAFNEEKGYGFIAPDQGEDAPTCDVFVHRNDLLTGELRPGARVSFSVMEHPKGFKARDVRLEDEITVRVFRDGASYCALLGANLQEGTAGFGPTQGAALRALADEVEPRVATLNPYGPGGCPGLDGNCAHMTGHLGSCRDYREYPAPAGWSDPDEGEAEFLATKYG